MEYRCDDCPLKKYDLDNVICASKSKPHPRYCSLAGGKYDEKITNESLRIHNEKVSSEGLPLLSIKTIKKFGKSMLKWAKGGFKSVPDEIYNERLSICNSCEHNTSTNGFPQCSLCTCIISEKCATNTESCPIKKWDVYQGEVKSSGGCGCRK